MIIDSLKDINSVADLFAYICKIEEENERLHKQIDSLLIQLNNKSNRPNVGFSRNIKNYTFKDRMNDMFNRATCDESEDAYEEEID